jgi:hypothetical protein
VSDGIVMLIILRIKYRFPDYSLAPNANRAHYRYTNKENDMRVPIYCGETFEALTIIKVEKWGLEMLDDGCRFLRFAPFIKMPPPPPRSVQYAGAEMRDESVRICTIQFERLRLGDLKSWIGVTGDGETALLLRSVFLPGQQSEVREAEANAQTALMVSMLKSLSR